MLLSSILFSTLLIGCGEKEENSGKTQTVVGKTKAKFQKFDQAAINETSEKIDPVPSPLKMSEMLKKAAIESVVAELAKERKNPTLKTDKESIAVQCGVLIADVVLMVNTAPKEALSQRLTNLKDGFNALSVKGGAPETIDEMIETLKEDNFDRKVLLEEMDDLSQAMVAELEYEAGTWVAPLIQAGMWLEGANLISNALASTDKVNEADPFIKQPGIIKYFLRYVQKKAAKTTPKSVVASLESTLKQLHEIAKKDKLSKEDLGKVTNITSTLLGRL